MPLAVCPECEAEIHVDEDVDKGEILHCEECEARLEVVGLDPIELDVAAEGLQALAAEVSDIGAVEPERATGRFKQSHEAARQRALAATRLTDNT